MLTTGYLAEMIERNRHHFTVRALFINNVQDRRAVARVADEHVRSGVLTEYHVVEDHAAEALRFFGLTKEQLGRGYYYSIAELAALYLARTD